MCNLLSACVNLLSGGVNFLPHTSTFNLAFTLRRQLTASIRNWVNFDLVYVDPNLMCVMYTWTTSTFILALTLLWQLTCNKHKVNFDLVQVTCT